MRSVDPAALWDTWPWPVAPVAAEQVHGAGVAIIEAACSPSQPIAGCDALITHVPAQALCVRTADCVPLLFAEPQRGVIGIAHAGWRGVVLQLPARVMMALRQQSHVSPSEVRVAIGPAIRACCYEVGPEFAPRFGRWVARRGGRWMCDLIGAANAQLRQAGVSAEHIFDSRRCTACEPHLWYSVRREGASTGRMTSFIMLKP